MSLVWRLSVKLTDRLYVLCHRSCAGKNKKKRQQLMKLVLIGATIKSKIELFLRVLSFHLQVKFFTIAAIGLTINIVRLWVDAKKGHQPQKVRATLAFWAA